MLRTRDVQEKCDRDARRAMRRLKEKLDAEDPTQAEIWDKKYKFFSNKKVKYSHDTFLKAQYDPLRGPLPAAWDEELKPSHLTYVERGAASSKQMDPDSQKRRSSNISDRTMKQLDRTMNRLDRLLQNPPHQSNLQPGAYAHPSKHKYFNGGCNFSARYRLQTQEPWEFCQFDD